MKLRLPRRRRLRWPLYAALGTLNVLVIAWFIAIHVVTFPTELLAKEDATSLRVVDANGILLRQEATTAGTRERWVPLAQISPYLVSATLASEDDDFYDHSGVDWTAEWS